MSLHGYKPKTKPALWKTTFPEQVDAVEKHIERCLTKLIQKDPKMKGVKIVSAKATWRVNKVSTSQAARLAEYRNVARAWIKNCQGCAVCQGRATISRPVHVHHVRGRLGALLTDTRFFLAMHDDCHRWVHEHPDDARKLGLLARQGDWGRPG